MSNSDQTALERRKAKQEMLLGSPERRNFAADMEVRTTSDGSLKFSGYASTTETGYDVMNFTETIARGAFRRTLSESPDVVLLLEHGQGGSGLPLARTTSGTLRLEEDSRGLKVDAELDQSDPDVRALIPKLERRDLTEMSFAFRVPKGGDHYNDDRTQRTIRELSIHRGDVSIVARGANPSTTGELAMRSALARGARRHSGRAWLELAKAKRARLRRDALPAQHVRPRYTHAEIQALGKKGLAHKKQNGEYNFPIVDRRDILDAIHAIGRAPEGERPSVKRWIVYRAEILNLKSLIPSDWKAEVHDAIHA